jgi:hypothetical protein
MTQLRRPTIEVQSVRPHVIGDGSQIASDEVANVAFAPVAVFADSAQNLPPIARRI